MRWVKALRSGKYKQGASKLCQNPGAGIEHCCLGVLADINGYSKELIRGRAILDLPGMQEKCDIKSASGKIRDDINNISKTITVRSGTRKFMSVDLAHINDEGASFKAIATWIEKNYKLL